MTLIARAQTAIIIQTMIPTARAQTAIIIQTMIPTAPDQTVTIILTMTQTVLGQTVTIIPTMTQIVLGQTATIIQITILTVLDQIATIIPTMIPIAQDLTVTIIQIMTQIVLDLIVQIIILMMKVMTVELIHIKTMLEMPINVDQGNISQIISAITCILVAIPSTRYQEFAILAEYSVINPLERYAEEKSSKFNAILVIINSTDYASQIAALESILEEDVPVANLFLMRLSMDNASEKFVKMVINLMIKESVSLARKYVFLHVLLLALIHNVFRR